MNIGQWWFTTAQIPYRNHRASEEAKLCSSDQLGASSAALSSVLPRLVRQEIRVLEAEPGCPGLDMEDEVHPWAQNTPLASGWASSAFVGSEVYMHSTPFLLPKQGVMVRHHPGREALHSGGCRLHQGVTGSWSLGDG